MRSTLRFFRPLQSRQFSLRSRISSPFSRQQSRPFTRLSPSIAPRHLSQSIRTPLSIRRNTTLATTPSSSQESSSPARPPQPSYELHFTCKPCSYRSGPHRITKQGYHHGSTLLTCPHCLARHIISDHLKIFSDEGGDLEEIMRRNGGKLKKGKLGIREGEMVGNEGEEMLEFWEDGTETVRKEEGEKEVER